MTGADVAFHWQTSGAAACLEKIVPIDFSGTIQCDGYAAYPSFAKSRAGEIKLAACWANIRRGFYEARQEAPQRIGFILRQIQHLYAIEDKLRVTRAGPRLREATRQEQSAPIVRRLHKLLVRLKLNGRVLPKSGFGQAIDYALGQWQGAQIYAPRGGFEARR